MKASDYVADLRRIARADAATRAASLRDVLYGLAADHDKAAEALGVSGEALWTRLSDSLHALSVGTSPEEVATTLRKFFEQAAKKK